MSPDPGPSDAREAIREVSFRYSRGVDRLDADLMRSAYWPDAVDDHGRFVGNGWEFVERVVGTHDRWAATMHCNLNHSIEFDDADHARGEIYNLTYL
ncbi:MAG: nuclear transport factor 2 family protein, partial [bacterium]|nr:nuclear transport factor 2 family protein [bacterium]